MASETSTPARVPADHFGGPIGALALTIVMPVATFYLWSAASQHGGSLWIPGSLDELLAMIPAPTWRATAIVVGWIALHVVLALVLPGKVVTGALLPNGERLPYKLNGLASFVISIAILVALLAADVFDASAVLRELGPLLTLATLGAFALAAWFYVWGRRRGALERSSGNAVYDFYMGTVLNPRFGLFDLKLFFESHVAMGSWGALAVLLPIAEVERTGELSTAMLVVSLGQLVYITDFFVFESNLLSMLDIIYENYGFMLTHAFLAWMPFNFTLQQQYLLAAPFELPWWAAAPILALALAGYVIFRASNLQKQRFRRDPSQPVWGRPPVVLHTKRGTALLASGWWGLARHTNYLGDLMMALAWCLACGFGSVLPYFYIIYFTPLLLNRERRDHALCKEKYGDDWDEYCRRVRYRIVPYVY